MEREASYFSIGDIILFGKYKSKKGKIVGFGKDQKGNPTVTIEPIPKGRKKNKELGLFRIWHAPVEEKIASEILLIGRVATRFRNDFEED